MITTFMNRTTVGTIVSMTAMFLISITVPGLPAVANGRSETNQEIRTLDCSNASLYGKYAVIGHGFAPTGPPPAPAGPFGTISLLTIDGVGNLTNKVTRSISGNISRGIDMGSYTIDADCTGTMTLITPTAPFPLTFDLVISDQRRSKWADEFYFIATSPGGTITATAKRLR